MLIHTESMDAESMDGSITSRDEKILNNRRLNAVWAQRGRDKEIRPHPFFAPLAWILCLGLGLAFWLYVFSLLLG